MSDLSKSPAEANASLDDFVCQYFGQLNSSSDSFGVGNTKEDSSNIVEAKNENIYQNASLDDSKSKCSSISSERGSGLGSVANFNIHLDMSGLSLYDDTQMTSRDNSFSRFDNSGSRLSESDLSSVSTTAANVDELHFSVRNEIVANTVILHHKEEISALRRELKKAQDEVASLKKSLLEKDEAITKLEIELATFYCTSP